MALTGQQISANLYFNNLPVNMSTVTYQWSTSSANAFENWDPNAPGDGTPNQLVPLKSSDPDCKGQNAAFTFYDAVGNDQVGVTCTAHFTYTDGTPGTVTVTTSNVTFLKPTATWVVNQWPGHPAMFDALNPDPGRFGPVVNWFPITASVPSPFTGGNLCFAQIAGLQRSNSGNTTGNLTDQPTVTWQRMNVTGGYPPSTYLTSGPLGLDFAFPYQVVNLLDSNNNFILVTDPNTGQTLPEQSPGYQWAVGQNVSSGDYPAQGINPASYDQNDSAGITWTAAAQNDTFNTWLMYMPPGANSVWVPLQRLGWAASGHAQIDANGNWTANGPTPPASQGSPTDQPPAWTVTVLRPLVYP